MKLRTHLGPRRSQENEFEKDSIGLVETLIPKTWGLLCFPVFLKTHNVLGELHGYPFQLLGVLYQ